MSLKWTPTTLGFPKLNVDGCSLGNPGECGGGWVVRDTQGALIAGFSTFYGWETNTTAEVRALLDGIRLCIKLQLDRIEIGTYLQLLVHWWNSQGKFTGL